MMGYQDQHASNESTTNTADRPLSLPARIDYALINSKLTERTDRDKISELCAEIVRTHWESNGWKLTAGAAK